MTKKERLKAIEKVILDFEISTQEELTERLIACGYNVSQSTISRDINELNLIKVEGVTRKIKYAKSVITENVSPQIFNLFRQVTLSIVSANNLIVIKTLAGNASAVGMAVDQMHFSEVLGTVAGDDTLLIITKSNSDAEVVVKTLRTL